MFIAFPASLVWVLSIPKEVFRAIRINLMRRLAISANFNDSRAIKKPLARIMEPLHTFLLNGTTLSHYYALVGDISSHSLLATIILNFRLNATNCYQANRYRFGFEYWVWQVWICGSVPSKQISKLVPLMLFIDGDKKLLAKFVCLSFFFTEINQFQVFFVIHYQFFSYLVVMYVIISIGNQ